MEGRLHHQLEAEQDRHGRSRLHERELHHTSVSAMLLRPLGLSGQSHVDRQPLALIRAGPSNKSAASSRRGTRLMRWAWGCWITVTVVRRGVRVLGRPCKVPPSYDTLFSACLSTIVIRCRLQIRTSSVFLLPTTLQTLRGHCGRVRISNMDPKTWNEAQRRTLPLQCGWRSGCVREPPKDERPGAIGIPRGCQATSTHPRVRLIRPQWQRRHPSLHQHARLFPPRHWHNIASVGSWGDNSA